MAESPRAPESNGTVHGQNAGPTADAAPSTYESDDRVNILMVDDRPEQLLVLETVLAGLKQNLVRANSGREALRYLLNNDCALILLDVNMPDLDGFETAALIRQRPRTRQTPIILVTACNETDTHVSRGYSLGAVDYIQTPVIPEILIAKVSVFVELARSARQVRRGAEQLEARVHERTEQLRLLNEALQAEIAERERAATEVDRLLHEAQEGVRRRDALLATLAHELRNPLAAIVNGLELLGLPGGHIEDTRAIVERQARHMSRLLQDLLDLSRFTRGKIELRQETVELGQLLAEVLDSKRNEPARAEHDLRLELPEQPLQVRADPTRILQVFDNLLTNASKYTPAGGRITISAEREREQAVIRIRDTGIGIAPDRLHQIFEPFVQLNQSHERPSEGLGIGLTLVRNLLELHGGEVTAASEGPGQGCEFTVRLPLDSQPEKRTNGDEQSSVNHVLAVQGRSIVLVEDNRDARYLLSKLLRSGGHRVEECGDGPGGVETIRRVCPDLAFIDIGLPGFDGYEVAANVRADPRCDDVRLIAMTGYGQPEDCRRALSAGFDAHLVKPVRIDELNRLLRPEAAAVAKG
jgi:signal transduction histidine kinase